MMCKFSARLQRSAMAYNLGNFMQRLALPRSVRPQLLTKLRQKLFNVRAKVLRPIEPGSWNSNLKRMFAI